MNHTRSVLKNALIYSLGGMIAKFSRFLLLPIYLIYLTQESVGILAVSEGIITFTTILLSLGFPIILQRDHDLSGDQVSRFYGLKIVSIIPIVCLLLGFYWLFELSFEIYLFSLLVGAIQSNLLFIENIFIAKEQPVQHRLFVMSKFLITFFCVWFELHFISQEPEQVVLTQGLVLLVVNIVSTFICKPSFVKILSSLRHSSLSYGIKSLPIAVSNWGMTFSDRFVLQKMVSMESISVYSVSYQICQILSTLVMGIKDAWRPRFFKSFDDFKPKAFSKLFTVYSWIIFVASLLIFLTSYLSETHLNILAQYKGMTAICVVILPGIYFFGLHVALISIPLFLKKVGKLSIASIIGFILNIIVNVILVPKLGILGSAIATLITYFSQCCFSFIYCKSLISFKLDLKFYLSSLIHISIFVALILVFY